MRIRLISAVLLLLILSNFHATSEEIEYSARVSLPELFDVGGLEEKEGAQMGRVWAANELMRRNPADVFAEARKRLKSPNPYLLTHAFSIHVIDRTCPQLMRELTLDELRGLNSLGKQQWFVHAWWYPAPEYRAAMLDILRNPALWQCERDLQPPLPVIRTGVIAAANYFCSHPCEEAGPLLQAALDFLPADARKTVAKVGKGFPFTAMTPDLDFGELVEDVLVCAIRMSRCSAGQALKPFAFSLLDLDRVRVDDAKPAAGQVDAWVAELEHAGTADEAAKKLLLRGGGALPVVRRMLAKNQKGPYAERLQAVHDLIPVVAVRRELLSPKLYDVPVKQVPTYDALRDLAARLGVYCDRLQIEEQKAQVMYGGANIPGIGLIAGLCVEQPTLCFDPPRRCLTASGSSMWGGNVKNGSVFCVGGVAITWGLESEQCHAFRTYALSRFWDYESAFFIPNTYVLGDGTEVPGFVFAESPERRRTSVPVESAVARARKQGGRASVSGVLRVWLPLRCNVEYAAFPCEKIEMSGGVLSAWQRDNFTVSTRWSHERRQSAEGFEALLTLLGEDGLPLDTLQPGSNLRMGALRHREKDASVEPGKAKEVRVIYFTTAEERWIPVELPEREILKK